MRSLHTVNYVLFQIYKFDFIVIPRQLNDWTLSTQLISRTKSLLEEGPIFPTKTTNLSFDSQPEAYVHKEHVTFYINKE